MKYEAEINGRTLSLELEERHGQINARVGDRTYALEVARPEDGAYLLFIGDAVYEAQAWGEGGGGFRVKIRDRLFPVRIIDRKSRRASSDHGPEGRQHLLAPMPGKVVRVLRAAGDEVNAGEGLVVVEAMKMQNEIKSPKRGRIVEIRVSEGTNVTANQVLAVVE